MTTIDRIVESIHDDPCEEPIYYIKLWYDRKGNGIVFSMCENCGSRKKYRTNSDMIHTLMNEGSSHSIRFKCMQRTSAKCLESLSRNAVDLITKEQS